LRVNNLVAGITIGDPAGIGPEVALKAVNAINDAEVTCLLVGRREVLDGPYCSLFTDYRILGSSTDLAEIEPGGKYLYQVTSDSPVPEPGRGSAYTGLEAKNYIDAAVGLWRDGIIDYLVTGPVSKGCIEKAGYKFTGHTEYLAGAIGESNPYMMMFSDEYRVLLATTHVPLAHVTGMLDEKSILDTIRAGHTAITAIDGGEVRIAVAGLDPHCGDEGAIGEFDEKVTGAAVRAARKEGIRVEGPVSADALFVLSRWKGYNLAIAHYHDQGLIPFKMVAFETGVNVTLGLSLTRTSVDHGTAFDIAGKNQAHHQSMISAIRLGYRLETGRRKAGMGHLA